MQYNELETETNMKEIEFKPWAKMTRENPLSVTITVKMNGTNSCVIVENGVVVGCQSRNRIITVDNDNFGFAKWVSENLENLATLGDGYHYGEWAGEGIQKNHHLVEGKKFFLFNTHRWNCATRPECCEVVETLFIGLLTNETIPQLLQELQDTAKDGETPEGVVVYHHALKGYTKHTIKSPNGKWCK